MAKDPLLRDAVRAIKAKIETAAEIATPEELAYLGPAIDRIGGRCFRRIDNAANSHDDDLFLITIDRWSGF